MNLQITATGTRIRQSTKLSRPMVLVGLGLTICGLIAVAALVFSGGETELHKMPKFENSPILSIAQPTMTYYLVDTQEYADVIQVDAEFASREQADVDPRSSWHFAVFVVDSPEAEGIAMEAINAAYLREIDGGAEQVKVVDLRSRCLEC